MINQNDLKDECDKLAKSLTDELADFNKTLQQAVNKQLLANSDKSSVAYISKQNANREAFIESIKQRVDKEKEKVYKGLKSGTEKLKLKEDKTKDIVEEVINKSTNQILASFTQNLNKIQQQVFHSNVSETMYETVGKMIEQSTQDNEVIYADGKRFRYENYLEMKVRTELSKEATDNFVNESANGSSVFFLCSSHANCADDHIDYQGLVYCSSNWEAACPEKYVEKVREYIESNKIITIEEAVGERCNYLTTRPNCRHFFQEVSITSVIEEMQNDKDREKYLEDNGLSFNPSYKHTDYEAMKEQRYNERQIRYWKSRYNDIKNISSKQPKVDLRSTSKSTKDYVMKQRQRQLEAFNKMKAYQKKNAKLIEDNPQLERDYSRETYGKLFKR